MERKALPDVATASLAFIVRQIDVRLTIPLQCLTSQVVVVHHASVFAACPVEQLPCRCDPCLGCGQSAILGLCGQRVQCLAARNPQETSARGGGAVILGEQRHQYIWDLQKFYDSIDVRHLLKLGAECGFPLRVAGVDLQLRLLLRALRWAVAFAKPRIVANSILAGSKFSVAYARNMLYGIVETVPVVRIDQHVDDLAQSAVCRQTAAIKQTVEAAAIKQSVEAAEITTFACDRLSLVISPKSTTCCSNVKTETLLRRGLLELGIHVGVTRRTRNLGVDT